MITNEVIFRESGQYDKETLQRLRIERNSLSKISNLESCTSLIELSLSHNEVPFHLKLPRLGSLNLLTKSSMRFIIDTIL